jgi:hypothetical protein
VELLFHLLILHLVGLAELLFLFLLKDSLGRLWGANSRWEGLFLPLRCPVVRYFRVAARVVAWQKQLTTGQRGAFGSIERSRGVEVAEPPTNGF